MCDVFLLLENAPSSSGVHFGELYHCCGTTVKIKHLATADKAQVWDQSRNDGEGNLD